EPSGGRLCRSARRQRPRSVRPCRGPDGAALAAPATRRLADAGQRPGRHRLHRLAALRRRPVGMAMSKPVLGMMLAAGVASAMWSCNRVDQAAVAARVNGRELPLSLFAGEAPERSGDAVARALDKAIDQELLVQ